MKTYYVKTGDTGSPTPQTFLEDANGDGVDLNGAVVRFLMRAVGTATPKVAADAEIVDASTGEVRYAWAEGDLDTPGVFRAEWEVTYSGGDQETFPSDGWIEAVVRADLDVEGP